MFADLPGQTPLSVSMPKQIVEFWSQRILGYSMPATIQEIVIAEIYAHHAFVDEDRVWAIPLAVSAILMSPEFQWR